MERFTHVGGHESDAEKLKREAVEAREKLVKFGVSKEEVDALGTHFGDTDICILCNVIETCVEDGPSGKTKLDKAKDLIMSYYEEQDFDKKREISKRIKDL